MARHPLLFKGFILLSLSSLHPQAYLKLTVERIEAELSTLYTRPAAEEEENRLTNDQHYEISFLESERIITEARMNWREGNFREVANLFADLLERDSGNATIRRYLHRTYEKLYPHGPTPRKLKTPAMDAFRAAMDVAQEYSHLASDERVENGETFRLTLLAMRQYLELYALLAGPRGGGSARPIAVTLGE